MEVANSQFSPAEYLTTFTTFIYGYVATQFLAGWSSMITHRKSVILSKEHLLWTIFSFVLLIDIWWTSWRKAEIIDSDNLIFYSTLITPFIFYFLSHLLFPDLDELLGNNLKTYLTPAFRKVMVAFACLVLSFLLSDLIFTKHSTVNIYFNLLGFGLASILIAYPAALLLRRTILTCASVLLLFHLYLSLDTKPPFDQVAGFSFIEYLTVFITFIYGFVAWRFLEGWGVIITHFKKLHIGFDFLPWTSIGFLLMLDMWWGTWAREIYLPQNILYFLLSLAVPILFYFLSAVIFPLELLHRGYFKLDHYYLRNRRAICFVLGLILFSNGFVATLMEENAVLSFENLFRFVGAALAIMGTFSSKLWVHRVVLASGVCIIIIHAITE